jgi:hypothetical protein
MMVGGSREISPPGGTGLAGGFRRREYIFYYILITGVDDLPATLRRRATAPGSAGAVSFATGGWGQPVGSSNPGKGYKLTEDERYLIYVLRVHPGSPLPG